MTRKEYIAQWYMLFNNYVNTTLGIIVGHASQVGNSMDWKDRLSHLKSLLEGSDVCDVKSDLSQGIVTDSTLDKTERIYAAIAGFLIDISVKANAEKECLKEMVRQFEHYRKQLTKIEIKLLNSTIVGPVLVKND